MKSKFILSSAFIMTTIGAFGADAKITEASTCTVDVLGVSDNNAVANTIATWDAIEYTLNPGQYLSVTDTSVTETTCPAGSYCVGGGFTVDNAATSIAQCPTGYENSAEGAGADTQCYTACTVATANIAHATAVTGNDYYGTGVDTCGATACETGYHVDGGELEIIEKEPLIPVNYKISNDGMFAWINANGNSDNQKFTDAELSLNNTWATEFEYGIVYGRASCQPENQELNAAMEYVSNNIESVVNGDMTLDALHTDLLTKTDAITAGLIMEMLEAELTGDMDALHEAVRKLSVWDAKYDVKYNTNDVGKDCYCQIDGFTSTGGKKEMVTSAPWIQSISYDSNEACASTCAKQCGMNLTGTGYISEIIRGVMYGALNYIISDATCAANTINIDWNPDNGGDHIKNMCTYEGSIELPTPDPVKPGYTFTGWKLVE